MGYPLEFAAIVPIVKTILKQKNMTYRELAKRMNMSEANVKKIMAAKDCSFARLNQICEVLDLSLHELLILVRQQPIRKVTIAPQLQDFLVSEEVNLLLYFKIAFEGLDAEKARRQLHLTEPVFWRKIRKMESLGLLSTRPDGSLRAPEENIGILADDGPIVHLLRREWMVDVIKEAYRRRSESEKVKAGLRYFRLSEKSAHEFREKLSALIDEFDRISAIEMKIHTRWQDLSFSYALIPDSLSNIRQRALGPL